MDTRAVEADLNRRIEDARQWSERDDDRRLATLMIRRGARDYPCAAELRGFIDAPNRIERHGLRFLLSVPEHAPTFTADLEVRIKPALSEGARADSPPYVIVYRTVARPGQERCVLSEPFMRADAYQPLVALSTQAWFAHWLRRAADRHFAAVFDRA